MVYTIEMEIKKLKAKKAELDKYEFNQGFVLKSRIVAAEIAALEKIVHADLRAQLGPEPGEIRSGVQGGES
jgi:hypothetical protein